MAIIKCPECGNDISDKAATCPHCGVDVQAELQRINNNRNDEEIINKQSSEADFESCKNTLNKKLKEKHIPFNDSFGHAIIIVALLVLALVVYLKTADGGYQWDRLMHPSINENNNGISTKQNNTVAENKAVPVTEKSSSYNDLQSTYSNQGNLDSNYSISNSIADNNYPSIGDSIDRGPIRFTLNNAYIKKNLTEYKIASQNAFYLVVEYSYTNISKESLGEDDYSRRIDESIITYDDTVYLSDKELLYDLDSDKYFNRYSYHAINPGKSIDKTAVFEIPNDILNKQGNLFSAKIWTDETPILFNLDSVFCSEKTSLENHNTSYGLYDPLLTKVGNVYAYFRDNETEQFTVESDDDGHVRLLGSYKYNDVSGTEELVLERDPVRDSEGYYGYKIIENTRRIVGYDEMTDTLSIHDKYEDIEYTRYNSGSNSISGSFLGEAAGIGGPVKVMITLDSGKIIDVQVEGARETPGIGSKAIEQLPAKMISGNTIQVDAISGATITSNAIKEAAKKALESAGLEMS